MQEISLNILDLSQNSISAGATLVEISVEENTNVETLTVSIKDNGCGMTPEQVKSVSDPFYTTRTTRKVGLGVPFFKMAAEMSGGNFEIKSKVGAGTKVTGVFGLNNIDRMPLGDLNGTISTLVYCNPEVDFVYLRSRNDRNFTFDTREIRKTLGGCVPLNAPEVSQWIRGFLSDGEKEVIGE